MLHLGCIGETDVSTDQKLSAFAARRVLHPHLMAAAREVVGLDLDGDAIDLNLGFRIFTWLTSKNWKRFLWKAPLTLFFVATF